MKKTTFIALVLFVTLTAACKKKDEIKMESAIAYPRAVKLEKAVPVAGIDISVIKTVGNHSYVPLNMDKVDPAEKVLDILQVLDAFEKSFPHLEITDWKIEKQQFAHLSNSKVFGLWIDHRPKSR